MKKSAAFGHDERRPDAVIHAAAANPGASTADMTRVNVDATALVAAPAISRWLARSPRAWAGVVAANSVFARPMRLAI